MSMAHLFYSPPRMTLLSTPKLVPLLITNLLHDSWLSRRANFLFKLRLNSHATHFTVLKNTRSSFCGVLFTVHRVPESPPPLRWKRMHNGHHYPILEHFHDSIETPGVSGPSLPPLATTSLPSVSLDLLALFILCKWKPVIHGAVPGFLHAA